jgi:hypothetical protein
LYAILEEVKRVLDSEGQLIVQQNGIASGLLSRRRIVDLCRDAGLDLVACQGARLRRLLIFQRPLQGNDA